MTFSANCAAREATLLTPERIGASRGYLDWESQPRMFKRYPRFCHRIRIADFPALEWVAHLRRVTDVQASAFGPYRRLNVPSAGNLHPIEIYLQIRNVSGVLSGIYHLDPAEGELVLVEEIASQGIEPYVSMPTRWSGIIVFFSIVPFRSTWKYGPRGWRYLYLDLGHQIGTFLGIADHFGIAPTKLSVPDFSELNRIMGMGEHERIAAAYALGEATDRGVRAMKEPLMEVAACDYHRDIPLVRDLVSAEPLYSETELPAVPWDEQGNLHRRSARKFSPEPLERQTAGMLFSLRHSGRLEVNTVVLRVRGLQCGVYREETLLREGDFSGDVVGMLLEQRFIRNAGAVMLIHAGDFDAASHIEAGVYAQSLYLLCEQRGIGCSGIGAFYDELGESWSDKPLVYAVAVGQKG